MRVIVPIEVEIDHENAEFLFRRHLESITESYAEDKDGKLIYTPDHPSDRHVRWKPAPNGEEWRLHAVRLLQALRRRVR